MDSATLWYLYQNYNGKEGPPQRPKASAKDTLDSKMRQGEFNIEKSGRTPDGKNVVVATIDQSVALIVDKDIQDVWDITKRDAAIAIYDRMMKVGVADVHPSNVGSEKNEDALPKTDLDHLKPIWKRVKTANDDYYKTPDFEHCDRVLVALRELSKGVSAYGSTYAADHLINQYERQMMARGPSGPKLGGEALPTTYELDHIQDLLHMVLKYVYTPQNSSSDPHMWEDFKGASTEKITLYHVTSQESASKIKQTGLKVSPAFDRIFLTDKAGAAVIGRLWVKGQYEVLKVELPKRWVMGPKEIVVGPGPNDHAAEYVTLRPIPAEYIGEVWARDRSGTKYTHPSGTVIKQAGNPEETGKWLVYVAGKATKPKAFDTLAQARAFAKKYIKEDQEWEREYWVVDSGNSPSAVLRYSIITRSWPIFHGKRGKEYGGAEYLSAEKLVSKHSSQEQAQAEADRLNATQPVRQPVRPPRVREGFIDNAHDAATSPLNNKPEPTQSEKEDGDYDKGTMVIHGMVIKIENPKGSVRSGEGWSTLMNSDYGYIDGVTGADGDEVDVFVGPNPDSENVYVVNQIVDGEFDEHKVVLGALSPEEAKGVYLGGYEDGWEIGPMRAMTVPEFKRWLVVGDQNEPV